MTVEVYMELDDKENDKNLLSILRDIQNECGYLPVERLREIGVNP